MSTESISRPAPADIIAQLRYQLAGLFNVVAVDVPDPPAEAIRFHGYLQQDAETAFDEIRQRFEPIGYTPNLGRSDNRQAPDVVVAMRGVAQARPSRAWINLLLFGVTVLTTLYAGKQAGEGLLSGLPFAVTLLVILGTHEFGHYFAARWHKADVTLPYFIPMLPGLSLLGTLGAVIQMRSPIRDRKQLLDVGVAGPLAGLVIAIPLLIYGLSLSPVEPFPPPEEMSPNDSAYLVEGDSLLYIGLKYLVKGERLPQGNIDVNLHPIAWAGWVGLLVTCLNLLPMGQLDGGHVVYALIGRRAWPLARLTAVAMLAMGVVAWSGWFIWAVLPLLFGLRHPPPLNDHTPLDTRRKLVGVLVLIVFILVFTPVPLTVVWPPGS